MTVSVLQVLGTFGTQTLKVIDAVLTACAYDLRTENVCGND